MSNSLLKISEAASIGLHAMIELAKHNDRLISVKEISATLDISANHLSKVMQRLCKAEYVESIKGFNGGFRLLIDIDKVTFLEIFELFDGKIHDNSCLFSKTKCFQECIFGDLITSINTQVKAKFENTKLSDFVIHK